MQERERLKSDLDLQRELDALRQERQMQKDEAKLKVIFMWHVHFYEFVLGKAMIAKNMFHFR